MSGWSSPEPPPALPAGGGAGPAEPSTGQLAARLSEQVSRLVRAELRLAQAEVSTKGKRLGVGAAAFGAAALLGLYALAGLLAAGVLALGLVLPYWLSALIVSGAALLLAGLLALAGKASVGRGTPPVPRQAMDSVKLDLAAIQEARRR